MADKDTLSDAKALFEIASEREALNRREALDDLRFSRLDEQWPEIVRRQRERNGRPCLTMNLLEPFIRQVVNDARQNQPTIKVHPSDSAADPKTAEIYNGLIRNIEVTSRADVAYDTALDYAVTMGFGYFRVNTEYAHDDSFDLDLRIRRIVNPFSVYADPYSTESDSSDWNSCFVTELIEKEQFRKKYKSAEEVDWDAQGYTQLEDPWRDDERIMVAEYFSRESVPKTILLLSDQTVVSEDVYAAQKDAYDAAGIVVISERETTGFKVTQRIMTGAEVLETNQWAGRFIPIVPVYGVEVDVEGRRHYRGLVRSAKDAQRMFNYWRTASTELVALAPKAPWIGAKGQFTTDAAKWSTANVENHAYMEFDKPELGAPQRQPFSGVPAGALQEAINASQDMKAIIGLYNASLGAQSNEISGRAILARQREGDVSTFHFIDNLSRAIEHCGRILIDLIPLVYTAGRMIRILGPEGVASNVALGQPVPAGVGPNGEVLSHVFDLGRGKYDLTVETGPSYTTRREEAASQMIELIRAFPAAAPVIGDQLAKNLDWPGADIIAARLAAMVPGQYAPPPGANAPASPQGGGETASQMLALQAANAKLNLQIQTMNADRQIEMQKLQLDAFRAQTDRMQAQAALAKSGSVGFAGVA